MIINHIIFQEFNIGNRFIFDECHFLIFTTNQVDVRTRLIHTGMENKIESKKVQAGHLLNEMENIFILE